MPDRRAVASFDAIEAEFIRRVHSMVWCNVATVDRAGRPRSRILHPFWEGQRGWITTRRQTLKTKHLARNPHASLAYVADPVKPVYVECLAEWDDSMTSKQHVWNLFATASPPLGYDPAAIFSSVEHPDFGVLRLTPWRVELADLTGESLVWRTA